MDFVRPHCQRSHLLLTFKMCVYFTLSVSSSLTLLYFSRFNHVEETRRLARAADRARREAEISNDEDDVYGDSSPATEVWLLSPFRSTYALSLPFYLSRFCILAIGPHLRLNYVLMRGSIWMVFLFLQLPLLCIYDFLLNCRR